MAILRLNWNDHPPAGWRGGATAVGNFDGVHRGHRALIDSARTMTREGRVVAVTFDPHPVSFLYPDKYQKPLMRLEERAAALHGAGADDVVVLHTSAELLALEPLAFFETILCRQLKAAAIVEGFNFRFGRGREGNNATLEMLCGGAGIPFREVPPLLDGDLPISTSRIRAALLAGDLAKANDWLCGPFAVEGTVGHGDQRGRTIGYPTANLTGIETVLPADGVYACRASGDGANRIAAVNVGPNPTFGVDARKVEAYLLDYSGDLYGKRLRLEFHARLRGTIAFAGVDALVRQMGADVAAVRTLLEGKG